MKIQIVQDSATRFLKENSTTVLTAGGVVGTVITGVVAFRAGFRSKAKLTQAEYERNHDQHGDRIDDDEHPIRPMTKSEKLANTWPQLIPPVVVGGFTIGSIIMAHRMSAAKIAALAAAYGVSQSQLEDYKAKLEEKLGVNKTEKAKAEMAQERADKTPGSGAVIIYGDEVLCFDAPTGRYFKSTMERINQAANTTNSEILKHNYAPASMFYSELELPSTTWSNDVGWDMPFQLEISTILVDGKPCISINFDDMPFLDYQRNGRGRDRYS